MAAQPDYAAAKAAVINMTVSLAKELANSGITVNTVTPGPIMTAGWVEWARGIASARGWGDDLKLIEHRVVQDLLPNSVGRVGRVDDIANAVTFLVSPLAGFINGTNLRVDGGSAQSVN